jgi:hypothetical protein
MLPKSVPTCNGSSETRSLAQPPPRSLRRFAGGKRRTAWLIVVGAVAAILVAVASWRVLSKASQPVHSVAVMPFTTGTHDSRTDELSDSMAEAIIDIVSQVPESYPGVRAFGIKISQLIRSRSAGTLIPLENISCTLHILLFGSPCNTVQIYAIHIGAYTAAHPHVRSCCPEYEM